MQVAALRGGPLCVLRPSPTQPARHPSPCAAVALTFFVLGGVVAAMLVVLILVRCTSEPVDSLDEVERKLATLRAEEAT